MKKFEYGLDKEQTTNQMFKICQYYNIKNVDLANLMYTTEVEISNWKTGKRFPEWDKIMLFAFVFDVSLDELVIRKQITKNSALEEIRNKIKKVDKINLTKTLEKKLNEDSEQSIKCYRNVRWNPLIQDWVPAHKYKETIEKALIDKLQRKI